MATAYDSALVFLNRPCKVENARHIGHVNNVVYYSYFDTAVNTMRIDADLLDIATGPVIGLVVETQSRYNHPLSFPRVRAQAQMIKATFGSPRGVPEIGMPREQERNAYAAGLEFLLGEAD